MTKLSELFSKKWFSVLVLIALLFFQLIYGFLFPSVGSDPDVWEPISALAPKIASQSPDGLVSKIYPLISPRYGLYTDASYYLQIGRDFSSERLDGDIFVERPLWPFLIFLSSLPIRLFASPSDVIIFGLAILLNLIIISAAVLLFFSLCRELFSLKVAWLSSILLIFSPFVHTYLNQPLTEILTVFTVVLSVYLLNNYIKKPSFLKLVVFSLLVGILMLGKSFFAVSFFILILAFYFRRFKEGVIFLIVHLAPALFWYLWVTMVWQINYYAFAVERSSIGTWVFDIIRWPWQEIYRLALITLPGFIEAIIYGFLLIPVIFSVIGWQRMAFKEKNIIYFGSFLAIFILAFSMYQYNFRHLFLLFPIIYPTCILGMERVAGQLRKYNVWLSPVFYAITIGFIVLISSVNIYQVFNYNQEIYLF